ncbi:MAG: hypothetical protein ACN6O2_12995 [Stenotrophomonas sp.]
MFLWLAVQHPYVLLVLGALLALILVAFGVFFRRLYDYWLWNRSREQRERDVVIAALATLAALQVAAIAGSGPLDADAVEVRNASTVAG